MLRSNIDRTIRRTSDRTSPRRHMAYVQMRRFADQNSAPYDKLREGYECAMCGAPVEMHEFAHNHGVDFYDLLDGYVRSARADEQCR